MSTKLPLNTLLNLSVKDPLFSAPFTHSPFNREPDYRSARKLSRRASPEFRLKAHVSVQYLACVSSAADANLRILHPSTPVVRSPVTRHDEFR